MRVSGDDMEYSHRRRIPNGLEALVVLCLVLAVGCAGAPSRGEPPTAGAPSVATPAEAEDPRFQLPPAPQRTEAQTWAEAERRAEALRAEVRQDLTNLEAGPVPEEVRAAAALSTAQPPKPKPLVPVSPPPAQAAPKTPVVGTAPQRVAVPSVRVAQKYTTENGLPSNRITALYVDDQDAWVGTADAGVARLNFAEGNWIVTKVEDGLASNRVSDIAKYKGLMYVATQEGISVWDGVAWSTQTDEGKVKLLNAVFRVHGGLLWVAARTMHGGLLSYDGERWKDQSTIKPGTILNNVSDFAFSGNTLWLGTTNRGLYRFDGKDWATITVADGIASNFVYTLAVKGESAYLGGCCGVSAFEGGAWRIYDVAEGLPHSTVNAIAVDGDLVWFGSKKGLGLFDGFQFTNFFTENGLTDDRISAIFVRGDDVWVGTANGLNRLEKSY